MSSSRYIGQLADVITQLKDKKTVLDFLHNILTPKELEEIAKRLQIVKMLRKGVPQRKIAEKLQVSIGTVSRGSRELQYGRPGFNRILL